MPNLVSLALLNFALPIDPALYRRLVWQCRVIQCLCENMDGISVKQVAKFWHFHTVVCQIFIVVAILS